MVEYKVVPVRDSFGKIEGTWFVVRLSDGAWLARCKTEVAAIASMQRRIAKDAAKQEIMS